MEKGKMATGQVDDVSTKEEAKEAEKPLRLRKAIPPHVLRNLSLQDPKRARRIIANRMSAARAKEKKKLQIQMLENEVQNLQIECHATSTQLALVQNEGHELANESSRLKERVSMTLQRISLQDELNEQIRKEVQYLKATMGGDGLDSNNAQPHNGARP